MSNKKRDTIILGVTGGIACGKSEAGRILGEMGFNVCDADRVAHDLMAKGTSVFTQVVEQFGSDILSDDGGISRPRLGRMVFNDAGQLNRLNQLVHPAVRARLKQWITESRNAGERAAVLIPLLFESGMQDLDWDATLCISSRRDDVITRLNVRGLTREEAEKRISSQMPLADKEKLADHVVQNHGTLGELKQALRSVVAVIEGER